MFVPHHQHSSSLSLNLCCPHRRKYQIPATKSKRSWWYRRMGGKKRNKLKIIFSMVLLVSRRENWNKFHPSCIPPWFYCRHLHLVSLNVTVNNSTDESGLEQWKSLRQLPKWDQNPALAKPFQPYFINLFLAGGLTWNAVCTWHDTPLAMKGAQGMSEEAPDWGRQWTFVLSFCLYLT